MSILFSVDLSSGVHFSMLQLSLTTLDLGYNANDTESRSLNYLGHPFEALNHSASVLYKLKIYISNLNH